MTTPAPPPVGIVMPLAEQRGGAERFLLHLLEAEAARRGGPYAVAFLEDGPMIQAARALGHHAEVFPAGQLRQPVRYVQTVAALAGWLRRRRLQTVLSWMTKAHLYAAPAAALAGVRPVWFQHGISDGHWMDRLATWLPAERVLCCSSAVEQFQGGLSPRRPTRVVYPSVDLERFSPCALPPPGEARARLGLDPDAPTAVMVARLERWKGVHVFIEAAGRVLHDVPDAQFVVVGGRHALDAGYADEMQTAADRQGGRVRLAGHRTDVPLWMQAADVVVHASVEPEPFGMVILEALALGKPVVATRAGGPEEILSEGEGVLVPPGDADALAGAVSRLFREPLERRAGRVVRARDRAREHAATGLPDRLSRALTSEGP